MSSFPTIDTFVPSFAFFFLGTVVDSNIEFCKSRGGTSARDVLITCTIKVVILSCTWVVVFNVPIARSQVRAWGIFVSTF